MKILAIAAASLVLLSGCASASERDNETDVAPVTIRLTGGKQVVCVVYDSGSYAGGISCDWEAAR